MNRIAFDARKIADFGIGSYVRGILGALAKIDRETEYLLLAPATGPHLLPGLPGNFSWIESATPGYSVREQLFFGGEVRRLRPDLFHSPHYVLPLRTPARTIVTVHDLIHLTHPELFSQPLAGIYARALFRRVARRAAHIICVSAATAADLEARTGIERERMSVIWNGIDDRFAQPIDDAALREGLRELNLAPGYFLFVGNPKAHKNLARLLAAFTAVRDAEARLVVVGGGGLGVDGGGGAVASDLRIRGLGRVDDRALPLLYRGARALLFPSLTEGFGLPVAEAMAAGTPVIASTTPAVAEIAEEAAELVDPLDVAAWTAAIERRLTGSGEDAAWASAGRRRATAFRWSIAARRTLDVYRTALSGVAS